MKVLLSKHDISLMPKPNEYHLILDSLSPPASLTTAALGLIFDKNKLLMTRLVKRGWDIPGGHIEQGETPEETVRREIYEETAVKVKNLNLFAYEKFILHGEEPQNYKYPYPVSYQLFYLGFVDVVDPFSPDKEALARDFFSPKETKNTEWGNRGSILYDAALSHVMEQYESIT